MIVRQATVEDAPELARVHVASWLYAFECLMPTEMRDAMTLEAAEQRFRERLGQVALPVFTLVAELGGRIVGFCAAGPDREGAERGEVYALYVHPEAHGRGVGCALVQEASRRLVGQGWREMLIWTLEGAAARGFYEHLGGHLEQARDLTVLGGQVPEVGYVWSDLRAMSARKEGAKADPTAASADW